MKREEMLSNKLLDVIESRGVSRRDFLKYSAAMAALFGISEFEFATKVVQAMERGKANREAGAFRDAAVNAERDADNIVRSG